ncbi:MAG: hypothetical protein JSU69_08320 [Candidatus Zixiibacteriota bacterium]|nr:MAG: hypothetical protein JSU69_08320 [candidate division Zixibacteria bacterium]
MKKVFLILFLVLAATSSSALTGLSIGLKGGIATNLNLPDFQYPIEELNKMNLIGGQVKISSVPLIDVIGTAEYVWRTKKTNLPFIEDYRVHDFVLTASIVYPYEMRVITPYAGIGISQHFLGFDASLPGVPLPASFEVPGDEHSFGYHLLVGVNLSFPVFPISLNGEFRAFWFDTAKERSRYNTLTAGFYYSFM